MSEQYIARIQKINTLMKRLRVSTDQLAALTDPTIDPRELEQILSDPSSIYRDAQSVAIIEEAIKKAHTAATDALNVKGSQES